MRPASLPALDDAQYLAEGPGLRVGDGFTEPHLVAAGDELDPRRGEGFALGLHHV